MALRVTPEGCRRVEQQRDAVLATQRVDLRHGLTGAHLRVGGLEHCCGDVTACDRGGIRLAVDPAHRVDRHRLVGAGLEQQHRALGRAGDHPLAGATAGVPQPAEPDLERRLRARVHRQLVGPHGQRVGQHLPGGVEQGAGPAAGRVQAGGVGPARGQGGPKGLRGAGVQGAPGGVEQPGHLRVERGARHA